MTINNYTNFLKAIILSFFIAVVITGFSIMLGKNNLFLLLNNNLGAVGDLFFKYATYLGDGVVWAIFAITILWVNIKKLPLVLFAIIISTIITHYIKGHLLAVNSRPYETFSNCLNLVHTIAGVEIHYGGSFPSGHTTQAFTMYFLLCILIEGKWVVSVGLLLALIVGYSRVYQAQHFPIDVAGGIGVAIFTGFVSIGLQSMFGNYFDKRAMKK